MPGSNRLEKGDRGVMGVALLIEIVIEHCRLKVYLLLWAYRYVTTPQGKKQAA
jgi:hypothetical protein